MNVPAMQPRQMTVATMNGRVSNASNVAHYLYNQAGVSYNQHGWTYNYTSFRGNMNERALNAPSMKGR